MSALEELRAALRQVEERLDDAGGLLVRGRKALAEAEKALADIDPEHPEVLVPQGLRRADDQIERTLTHIEHITEALRGFEGTL